MKKKQKQSAGGVNVVLQAVIMDSFTSDVKKKAETKLKRLNCYRTRTQ